ncbi:MAG: lysophospholipid acyltransferase family protein [Bacteroidia bacterium]|nr:lysophospholipid acyltransferase family protein [Bacteroidia bacterium]
MKELISKSQFTRATQLEKFGLAGVAGPLMHLTGLVRINRIYQELIELHGLDFVQAFMERMEIEVEWEGNGLKKIPKEGAFITVSNHPFGAWDAILLLNWLAREREDFKVMANLMLEKVDPIKDYLITVNPFEDSGNANNVGSLKRAVEHLKEGHPLGIFPAGEVSTFQPKSRTVSDREWQIPAIKLIQLADVPVIPIYFSGANSPLFHLMGMIHPLFKTVRVAKETLKMRQSKVKVRVGSPILPREIRAIDGEDRLGRYLRARTYTLGSDLEVNKFFRDNDRKPNVKGQPVIDPVDRALILKDLEGLGEEHKLCSQAEFDIYCANASYIPNVLEEIGRLREITFREAGEGTGQAKDLDEYDLHYLHLFMWDREAQQIAGAYRMGQGDLIVKRYGIIGFYTASLFNIQEGILPILEASVELGRSFIIQEYQKKRLSLFLLWKGIYTFLKGQAQYKYLIGPVSISNDYTEVSKSLMVSMVERFFFDHDLAKYVQPRKEYKPDIRRIDFNDLLDGVGDNLKNLDKIIEDIEPSHIKLPVLLKKYIRQNARIIAFNVDPNFNDALDGFMVMDLSELPEATDENMKK